MITLKVNINGTVQGVFFRNFVKEKADSAGVRGFVRNMDDGSVEAYIEGIEEKVKEMMKELRQGPKNSKIKEIKTERIPYQGFEGFKISIL